MSKNNDTTSKFKKNLTDLLKARFPYLYISTWEEDRVTSIIKEVCQDKKNIKTSRKVFTWTLTQGISYNGKCQGKATKSPLKALEFVEKCKEPSVFIFKDFHTYFGAGRKSPNQEVIRKIRDMLVKLKQGRNPRSIIFTSPSVVLPDELQKDVTVLEFDLPTETEIRSLLDDMISVNSQSGNINIQLTEEEKEQLSKGALGLTFQEAENAFARAMAEDGVLNQDDLDVIIDEKCQVIKKTGILEYVQSDFSMEDVGGLQNIKRWLKKRDKSWLDSAQKYSLPAPKGVLITGIPGCGKSLIAKSISNMWHLPLLRLDMGKIFSGVVGSSEENMRRAIKTAEAVAPSILWIDEIEKGLSGTGSGGDGGTSTRVFGKFLTWMQEKTKSVFVVATANNIDVLPAELLRKGRFDEIFFVDLPTKKERKDIFELHIKKRVTDPEVKGDFELNEQVLDKLADITEGFVGAEIEQAVISALFEAFYEKRSIKFEDFQKSVVNTVPLSVTQAEQIKSIRDWANVRAVAATPQEDREDYKVSVVTDDISKADEGQDDEGDFNYQRGGRAIDF